MVHPLRTVAVVLLYMVAFAPATHARKATLADRPIPTSVWSDEAGHFELDPSSNSPRRVVASAVANTLVLASYTFDGGPTCAPQGWTTIDRTAQSGDWWHADDFSDMPWAGTKSVNGITFNAIQGLKSMWLAALPPSGPVNPILCGYANLPGYGNNWNQAYCSKACLSSAGGATANLDMDLERRRCSSCR